MTLKQCAFTFVPIYFYVLSTLLITHSDCLLESTLKNYTECKVPSNGKQGICINLKDDVIRCPTLRNSLLDKNFTEVHSAVCGEPDILNLNETIVCCAVDEFIELYSSINTSFENHTNFKLIPKLEDSQCGISFSSTGDRIVGGNNAFPGEHPWMCRLGMSLSDDDEVRFPCSGSILNDRYIITAAHCFKQGILRFVRLGETDEDIETECIMVGINSTVCQSAEDYEPEDLIIHSGYTGKIGSLHDIALIRLKTPIRNLSSPFTKPVCLPFIHEFQLPDLENFVVSSTGPKNLASVQGWGKENNHDNVGTSTLKQVYVPVRSNAFCRHVFQRANLTITDEQLCVGGSKGKGSCAGDSGSPLMFGTFLTHPKVASMRMFQMGIVSYGRQQCGVENTPVVYTRIRSHLQFILDTIKP